MRLVGFSLALLTSGIAVASCSGNDGEAATLCVPGENIFCRCRGGAAGTKLCLDDGESFGECETLSGACTELSSTGSGNGGDGGSQLPGGGNEPPPNPGELLASCERDADCESGHCPMGFCTKGCDDFEQCAPPEPAAPGDCVTVPGASIGGQPGVCVPYCLEQAGCEAYGPNSLCSYTEDSLPAFGVVVCADWGDTILLPPDGYPEGDLICTDDVVCNLGLDGTERICADGDCGDGCNDGADCPDGVMCNQAGTCGQAPDEDDCPGVPVSLPTLGASEALNGNTFALSAPAEHEGSGACGAIGTNAEEAVYAVTAGVAGNLIVLVEPVAGFDAKVYIRSGTCSGTTQVGCADDGLEGGDEIVETAVGAGETVYVFVDGFDGSAGGYTVTFDLDS